MRTRQMTSNGIKSRDSATFAESFDATSLWAAALPLTCQLTQVNESRAMVRATECLAI